MNPDLHSLVDSVHDEPTFLLFLSALAADREDEVQKEKLAPAPPYSSGVNGWENSTIEGFLEAASRWAEDSKNGLQNYRIPQNPWKRCAEIMLMGKHYE